MPLSESIHFLPALAEPRVDWMPWWAWLLLYLFALLVIFWWLLNRRADEQAIQAKFEHAGHGGGHPEHEHAASAPAAAPEAHAPQMAAAVEAPAAVMEAPAAAEAPVAAEAPIAAAPESEAPAPAPAPDDLKIIEGIGPKVAGVLNRIGIFTFQQLAEADLPVIRQALEAAGYRYMDPASWPQQAGLAAEGKWEALQALQDGLKGGRR
jgi:predicted flap endonuclease-1-like 5' DNA nuclease